MEHFHYKIPGWFTFPHLYSHMVERYDDGAHFVEIGAWQGCSTAFMAVEIINSGKKIRLDVVDRWGRYALDGLNTKNPEKLPDDLVYKMFLDNIEPVKEVVQFTNIFHMDSVESTKYYKDDSLDFIFIDADHTYEGVMRDLKAWYPKLKFGGHIAGHDYFNDEGVRQAVKDFFERKDDSLSCGEQCWCYFSEPI